MPRGGRLRDLRQTCEISGHLGELLVIEILVGHKGGHDARAPANSRDKLRGSEFMARERDGKSALSLNAVAKLTIVLQIEIALPDFLSALDVGGAGSCLLYTSRCV